MHFSISDFQTHSKLTETKQKGVRFRLLAREYKDMSDWISV